MAEHSFICYVIRLFIHTYSLFVHTTIAMWAYINEWSPCTATCFGGTQTRTQSCVHLDNTTASDGQCEGSALSEVRACNEVSCRKYRNNTYLTRGL